MQIFQFFTTLFLVPLMPVAGLEWKLLFRQTAGTYMEANKWLCVEPTKPSNPNYSILAMLGDDCKDDKGKFEFKIVWPKRKGPNYNIWRQSTNPVTDVVAVEGYEDVDVQFKTAKWGGLENGALNAKGDQKALLDGSVNNASYFFSIGATAEYDGGIPGPDGKGEQEVELYAKCKPVTDPFNKYLCPKCAVNRKCGLSCCAPGAAWEDDCSDDGKKSHTWGESKQACERGSAITTTDATTTSSTATPTTTTDTASTTSTTSTTEPAAAQVGDEDNTDGMLSTPTIVGVAVGVAVVLLAVGVGVGVAVCLQKTNKTPVLIRPKGVSDANEDDSDDEGNGTQRRASVTQVVIKRTCSKQSIMAAAEMYRLKTVSVPEVLEPEALDARTFITSNFKAMYDKARVPEDCVEILTAVKMIIKLYSESRGIDEVSWQKFYKQLYDEAWTQSKVLQGDVAAAAEYIWTSNKSLNLLEFCSMLNAAIRGDNPDEMVHAAMFARAINARRVRRDPQSMADTKYPHDGKLWRGTGFDNAHQGFFAVGHKYRVPGLLATSLNKRTSEYFITRTEGGIPTALWCILVDPAGKKDFLKRNRNASYVAKTHLKGEGEYLFAAYSVFTCVEANWSQDATPHHITIKSAHDNASEADDLPLAPWY